MKYWQELYLRISPKNIAIGEFYCWSMHRINKNVGFMLKILIIINNNRFYNLK